MQCGGGPEQELGTCYCDVWGNPEGGGRNDAILQQGRVQLSRLAGGYATWEALLFQGIVRFA